MENSSVSLASITAVMREKGADLILLKALANNDNSKQQIYLGRNFDVLRAIPTGEVVAAGMTMKDGPIFKAPLNLQWITPTGQTERAPHAQIILYPRHGEIRLSGTLKNCRSAPSELMRPPTPEERSQRKSTQRYMVLGIGKEQVFIFVSPWGSALERGARQLISSGQVAPFASVFYEYTPSIIDTRTQLLQALSEIYRKGPIESSIFKNGLPIPYLAQNGAGYTLEALFSIAPNGKSDPDYLNWELKAHSRGAVTMMTPEPDSGVYLQGMQAFMSRYATRSTPFRQDFTGQHKVNIYNQKSGLTLTMEGYDAERQEILDPDGGLYLRDASGVDAAGWSFSKLLNHWKKKHANTCFVSYNATNQHGLRYYQYGPRVTLATGSDLRKFLGSLDQGTLYYDPGNNLKLVNSAWRSKSRNQFRVAWRNIDSLHNEIEHVNLNDW